VPVRGAKFLARRLITLNFCSAAEVVACPSCCESVADINGGVNGRPPLGGTDGDLGAPTTYDGDIDGGPPGRH
jgi:hypothetical protein